jgi:hypothetical protein
MVSQDIRDNKDRYVALMQAHGRMECDAIIASVRETQAELLALLKSASDEQALRAPAPGEWCLRELAMHAVFAERLVAKIIHHGARGEAPSAEDLAGAGIGMMPRDEGQTYAELIDALQRTNEEVATSVRELPASPNMEMKMPHPFFGPLNCKEWAGFQRVHDLDHIQHARRILAGVP